jgi:hypothetical protein
LDTNLTAIASPSTARSLHEICEAARLGTCGPFCGALPGDECVFTSAPVSVPVTGDTPMRPVRGYHMARFGWAHSHGLISAAELAAVTGTAGSPAPTTVIYDTTQGGAISGDRKVLGPFETAAQARLALRPADGSFVAPQARLALLTDTLRAAGVELGPWDQQVARWLADLDVQAIAPVIGWVSRAGREPPPGLIARALADAIAYQTALTSSCPECAQAAPEGCADHRQDAARAAEYEQALRCPATGRDAQLRTPARPAAARCRPALRCGASAHDHRHAGSPRPRRALRLPARRRPGPEHLEMLAVGEVIPATHRKRDTVMAGAAWEQTAAAIGGDPRRRYLRDLPVPRARRPESRRHPARRPGLPGPPAPGRAPDHARRPGQPRPGDPAPPPA